MDFQALSLKLHYHCTNFDVLNDFLYYSRKISFVVSPHLSTQLGAHAMYHSPVIPLANKSLLLVQKQNLCSTNIS